MKVYISCLKITERGWIIPPFYNRDSKSTKEISLDLFKKDAKTSEMGQRFHLIGNIIIKDENQSS
jgi:hypothetical protein